MVGVERLQQVVALNVLEIAIGAHLQLVAGSLVADDDAVLVHLQGRKVTAPRKGLYIISGKKYIVK